MNKLIINTIFRFTWKTTCLLAIVGLLFVATDPLSAAKWRHAGFNKQNTHDGSKVSKINKGNVHLLQVENVIKTAPTGFDPFAGVITFPASTEQFATIKGKWLYIVDLQGNLYKYNIKTQVIEDQANTFADYSGAGGSENVYTIRSSPTIKGNKIFAVTSRSGESDWNGCLFHFPGCFPETGMFVLAIDRHTLDLVWKKNIVDLPLSTGTSSPLVVKDKVIVGTSSHEEQGPFFFDPELVDGDVQPYQCCENRGKTVALDRNTGDILWEAFHTPGQEDIPADFLAAMRAYLEALPVGHPGHLEPGDPLPKREGFFGTSIVGIANPAFDKANQAVIVGPGSNYMVPRLVAACLRKNRGELEAGEPDPQGFLDTVTGATLSCADIHGIDDYVGNQHSSIVSLDINTGATNWSFSLREVDLYNHWCTASDFGNLQTWYKLVSTDGGAIPGPSQCADPQSGFDYGQAQGPMLLRNVNVAGVGVIDLISFGSKGGEVVLIDASTGGSLYEKVIKPIDGGQSGGIELGHATDGQNVFYAFNNSTNLLRDIRDPFIRVVENTPISLYGTENPALPRRDSGPRALSKLINPPSDQFIDADVELTYVAVCEDLPTQDEIDRCNLPENTNFENEIGDNPFRRKVVVMKDWRDPANASDSDNPNTESNPITNNLPSLTPNAIYTVRNLSDCSNPSDKSTCTILTTLPFWASIDAGTGEMNWSRTVPAAAGLYGSLSHANGVLFSGANGANELTPGAAPPDDIAKIVLGTGKGLRFAIDADTGEILLKLHESITEPRGSIGTAPSMNGKRLFWGSGAAMFGGGYLGAEDDQNEDFYVLKLGPEPEDAEESANENEDEDDDAGES